MINGWGRARLFHPEFLALCGCYCLQPIACERRDPESKGIVEGGMRDVKHNALSGRADELVGFEDYAGFATRWRDEVANVRIHETTRQRPVDPFQRERPLLRALPAIAFDADGSRRQSSAPMRGSNSMATATPAPPQLAARRSRSVPNSASSACSIMARWSLSTFARTSEES